ncbi:alpha/beta hydrolase [Streptomyces sp. TLI_171]|uniref:alpha/beta hydrolase n=1 Tax=Streptomyces sp. TLI_171 TaxID=1938859 RepID=UPI000C42DB81|nr:hypothetical protein [Streptomyces sp. TLI_171]RKE23683.1 alpha-beta hydrolase superfamily lysophospholipase [Streptomyces sp. TLI_171]
MTAPAPALLRQERWEPAEGTAVRGTVVLLPGRGEHPALYARFGRRLALDGYRLVVPGPTAPAHRAGPPDAPHTAGDVDPADGAGADPSPAAWSDRRLEQLGGDLAALTAHERGRHGGPVVLAGSDTGALLALAAATTVPVDALLLAGLPSPHDAVSAGDTPPDWADDELSARTACPVHRSLLADSAEFRAGALLEPVAAELAAAAATARPTLPVLAFHGLADPVAPVEGLRALARRLPSVDALGVADGRHDVFNDAAHRSVAARTVQWLEALRAGLDRLPATPPALLVPLQPGRPDGAVR